MFTRTGRFAFCKNGPAPNIFIPAGSNRTRSGCRLLAGREFAPVTQDRNSLFWRAPSRARNFISAGSK
jgi:hypothetical protein